MTTTRGRNKMDDFRKGKPYMSKCIWCDKEFEFNPATAYIKDKFCSHSCAMEHTNNMIRLGAF